MNETQRNNAFIVLCAVMMLFGPLILNVVVSVIDALVSR